MKLELSEPSTHVTSQAWSHTYNLSAGVGRGQKEITEEGTRCPLCTDSRIHICTDTDICALAAHAYTTLRHPVLSYLIFFPLDCIMSFIFS